MNKNIPIILALMSSAVSVAEPVSFPGNMHEAPSPNGKYAVVWVEAEAAHSHELKLRLSNGKLIHITNMERHASIEWSPLANEFAVSDAFASNVSRVLLYSVSEKGEITPVELKLPNELAEKMKSSGHAYIQVSHWLANGLSLVASGYGEPEEQTFEKALLCNHASKGVVVCHEEKDR